MSTIYIICATIIASIITITTFVVVGAIERHKHINLNWVLLIITLVLSCSLIMVLIYHNQNDITLEEVKESYNDGYNQAIEDTVLVESNEDGYTLSFNGEYHVYTYD